MKRRFAVRRSSLVLFTALTMVAGSVGMDCPPPGDGSAPLNPPSASGNRSPRIIITDVTTPSGDNSAEQGEQVTIAFTGEDAEDTATVRIFASTSNNPSSAEEIPIMSGFTIGPGTGGGTTNWDTNFVVPDSYSIFAEIDDQTFNPFTGVGNLPVRVTFTNPILVAEEGTGPQNGSPTVTVQLPSSDAGLSNQGILTIRATISDPNSDVDTLNLSFLFDTDRNAANDDDEPPLVVETFEVPAGTAPPGGLIQVQANIEIDLNTLPVRREIDEGGRPLPYFPRVQVDDGQGGVVNGYSVGAVRLLAAASGVVDLLEVGGRVAGATWQGFNGVPEDDSQGSRAGSAFSSIGDLDFDGIPDFVIVSGTASPFNPDPTFKQVGEAYVIYGRARFGDPDDPNAPFTQGRYSGVNSLNTVGSFVPFPATDPRFETLFNIRGSILPHPRVDQPPDGFGSLGISSVTATPDMTGDGLPEVFVGSPYNDSIRDREDDDPCDRCTFTEDERTPLTCFEEGDLAQFEQAVDLIEFPLDGNEDGWLPFDPSSNDPINEFTPPNVVIDAIADDDTQDDDIEPRLTKMFNLLVIVRGEATIPPDPAPGRGAGEIGDDMGFDLTVKLDGRTGPEQTQEDIVVEGNDPEDVVAPFEVAFTFPVEVNTDTDSNFPVGNSDPPNDFVPPSVFDGRFTVFVQIPTDDNNFDLDAVVVRILGAVGTPEPHPIRFVYNDNFDNRLSDTGGCDDIDPEPVDPIALDALSPACPPLNFNETVLPNPFIDIFDDLAINRDGHICDDLQAMGIFGATDGSTNDGIFDDPSSTDDSDPYQSGHVFVCGSNDLVLPLTAAGTWTGQGFRTAPLGRFGQPPYVSQGSDGMRGGRFRGAWYQPDVIYDPLSLFGYTVDAMPDLDTRGLTTVGELMISAPNSGSLVNFSPFNIPAMQDIYVGEDQTSNDSAVDFGAALSSVTSAVLRLQGTSINTARLRVSLVNGAGSTIEGSERDALLWDGDRDSDDDFEYDEYFTLFPTSDCCLARLENSCDSSDCAESVCEVMPSCCDLAWTAECVDLAMQFCGDLCVVQPFTFIEDETDVLELPFSEEALQILAMETQQNDGRAMLRLEILPDCTVEGSGAVIESAEFEVSGLIAGAGLVTLVSGQDYTVDLTNCPGISNTGDLESPAVRPMSIPSVGCLAAEPPDRVYCFPPTVAEFSGEAFMDQFGWARNAGNFGGGPNGPDGVFDIACGAPGSDNDPFNPDLTNCPPDEPGALQNNGKVYFIYGRPVLGSGLPCADLERFEIRGSHNNDQFGRVQGSAGDMNNDARDDVYFAAENYDATGDVLGVDMPNIGNDVGFVGVLFGDNFATGEIAIHAERVGTGGFPGVKFVGGIPGARLGGGLPPVVDPAFPQTERGQYGVAGAGDFNLDGFDDLLMTAPGQPWPAASISFVGPVSDGDSVTINGITFEFDTNGVVGGGSTQVSLDSTSAAAAQAALLNALEVTPGETLNIASISSQLEFPEGIDDNPTLNFVRRQFANSITWITKNGVNIDLDVHFRLGVSYLVFGSNTLLTNQTFILPDDLNRRQVPGDVTSPRVLKGIVFVSAYRQDNLVNDDTPDEAPIEVVAGIDDIDGDGFPDIMLGAPQADFINILAPDQRRQAAGEAYTIYGNQFGLNDGNAP
ncbi:MAG: hypothetical protein MI923_02525 [Phycisphaerales bacterium]|nr:hypothetical protein [Phycisphaerales bacterium]